MGSSSRNEAETVNLIIVGLLLIGLSTLIYCSSTLGDTNTKGDKTSTNALLLVNTSQDEGSTRKIPESLFGVSFEVQVTSLLAFC